MQETREQLVRVSGGNTATGKAYPPASWNATNFPFSRDATIDMLVAAAAQAHPHRPALVGPHGTMTHEELGHRSDQLAAHLRSLGVGPRTFVASLTDHTAAAVVGLLGILKAGGAYVPLDPRWPARRLRELLGDMRIGYLLTEAAHVAAVVGPDLPDLREVILLDVAAAVPQVADLDREAVSDLWDYVAGMPDPLQAAGFNLPHARGHVYTQAEVDAYASRVVSVVRAAVPEPHRVLEVGCGSGLITRALAPYVDRYVATDPSEVATAAVADWASSHAPQVIVATRFADEIANETVGDTSGDYDVVLLSSTIQFFPHQDYLVDVLTRLARRVVDGGAIVIADVIDPDRSKHGGLCLAPSLFEGLALDGRVRGVRIHHREPGSLPTALVDRYDVVIDIGGEAAWTAPRITTQWHIASCTDSATGTHASSDDPAYVIFTSGSTGRPKGVVVKHRSVVNLIEWVNRVHHVTPDDRLLFATSFAFDLSVYDMFGVLSAGASIRIVPDETLDEPDVVAEMLLSEPITFWDSAPAKLASVLPFVELSEPGAARALRRVFLSGDWIPVSMPDRIRRQFPNAAVIALGGATECTVWSNHFPVGEVDPEWPSIPYGRPMQHARYYLLDRELTPCPVGDPGDLYIAGECVAAGYAGDPVLTAQRFLPEPGGPPGGRMYRTGDRARFLPDGNIQFLGRDDDQVKVRGYRIELGEVQAVLRRLPGVLDAIVLADRQPRGTELVAFVVPCRDADEWSGVDRVHRELAEHLPAYMVPARFVEVATLPLSNTGKVDRAELLRMHNARSGQRRS